MGKRTAIRRPRKDVSIGDMGSLIQIVPRNIQPPVAGDGAHSQLFGTPVEVWASVSTPESDDIFDAANLAPGPTHEFHIKFRSGLTAESWVKHKNDSGQFENYRILNVMDFEERHEFHVLSCVKKGDEGLEVNQ